jgi:NAD+ kinase
LKNFFIVTRSEDNSNSELIRNIQDMIRKRGGVSDYGVFSRIQDSCPNIPKGTECMISVGGDGTLVFASKLAMRQGIPIVGVNRGHMGFLCDLDDSTVEAAIDSLFSDEYETEDRMMLRGSIRYG